MEVSGQLQVPSALPVGKNSGAHFRGDWLGSKSGLDGYGEKKILIHTGFRTPDLPALPSLYTNLSISAPLRPVPPRKLLYLEYEGLQGILSVGNCSLRHIHEVLSIQNVIGWCDGILKLCSACEYKRIIDGES